MGCGIGDVVRGHVDGLERGDRPALQRCDPLLEKTHLFSQIRLVADLGRHAAEKCRHLGPGLGESEYVVDEQQHILLLHITEVLGHRQRGKGDTETDAGRLVHLTECQSSLVDNARLLHLEE